VGDKIAPFGRPPTFFGVRFRFAPWRPGEDADDEDGENEAGDENALESAAPQADPPTAGEAAPVDSGNESGAIQQVEEGRGFVTVRFEPYSEDPSQVWIEVAANYIAPEPIRLDDLSIVEQNILETCRFSTDNCKRFLDQFDPQVDSPGGQS
jgi:hypothetical protein